ncbi:MAG: hypothetical protein U1F34_03125 [Gammaproteobacteria bacterium]
MSTRTKNEHHYILMTLAVLFVSVFSEQSNAALGQTIDGDLVVDIVASPFDLKNPEAREVVIPKNTPKEFKAAILGSLLLSSDIAEADWSDDPFVAFNLSITNITDGPIELNTRWQAPIVPISTLTNTVIGAFEQSVTDTDGNGSASFMNVRAQYMLSNHPSAGSFDTSPNLLGIFNADLIGPGLLTRNFGPKAGPALANSTSGPLSWDGIFITWLGLLSPHDTVHVSGWFCAVPDGQTCPVRPAIGTATATVPLPGAIWSLCTALLGLAGTGMRRGVSS